MRTSNFHSTRGCWQRRFVSQANLNFYKNALLRQVMLITDVRALEHQKYANNIVFLMLCLHLVNGAKPFYSKDESELDVLEMKMKSFVEWSDASHINVDAGIKHLVELF